MRIKKPIKAWCLALATASTTFITAVTCDPYTGYLDFFRDTDSGDYYYDDVYYDDVFYDEVFYDDDPYYYDDCFFGCY